MPRQRRAVLVVASLAAVAALAAFPRALASESPREIRGADGALVAVVDAGGLALRRSHDGEVVAAVERHSSNVDHASILDATGKRALYLADNDFVYDEADPRVRLAQLDGGDLRRGNGGPIAMTYAHPDLSPDAHASALFRVEGAELDRAQLVAVLWVLRPDLFRISDEDRAAQIAAYEEAKAEEERRAREDWAAGTFTILTSGSPDDFPEQSSGRLSVRAIGAGVYEVELACPDLPAWRGAAVKVKHNGDPYLVAAIGAGEVTRLSVYTIAGGQLTGKSYPGGAPEALAGPEGLEGAFEIAGGEGTASIFPDEETSMDGVDKVFAIGWQLGSTSHVGPAIRFGDTLAAARSDTAAFSLCMLKVDRGNGVLVGDFITPALGKGYFNFSKASE